MLSKPKLENKITSGPGDVLPKLLKDCSQYIITLLTHLVKVCFENGEFALRLQTSKEIPKYKKIVRAVWKSTDWLL